MRQADLEIIAARLNAAGNDIVAVMRLIGNLAGEWIEMRHTPPNPELDGFRSRADVARYLMREAEFFPGTFDGFKAATTARVEADYIVIDPLSFSGKLAGQDRQVDIRYILNLHFDGDAMCKITGALTRENKREDLIAWLKVIQSQGGLGQTLALEKIPAPDARVAGSTPTAHPLAKAPSWH